MDKRNILKILACIVVTAAVAVLINMYFFGCDDTWYRYVPAPRLNSHSPLNIGAIALDAPAGKHGFVTARGGHFYFEDGAQARFWGTNLCYSACFPSKKNAEVIADRAAFFGFNAVRLHHMDQFFEPRGIFRDIVPEARNAQLKKTGILSEEQLDKLDYLIYQLKRRGIYIDMNLLVSRRFTEADGVREAASLNNAAKPASLFDRRLIELQKQYAYKLITHYNPYTKLRYCDDPAIALIELTNENSLFDRDIKKMPRYYLQQLQEASEERNHLYVAIEKRYFAEMARFLRNDCGVKVPITGVGGYRYPQELIAQKTCDYIDTHAYWDHPKFPHMIWDKSDFAMHGRSMLQDDNLGIIGSVRGREPARQDKPYTISEWSHCYPNPYAYETPVLLASTAAQRDWDGLFQYSFSHGLKTHPVYNNISDYFDIISNPQQLILCSLGSILFHRGQNLTLNKGEGFFTVRSPVVSGMAGFIKDRAFVSGGLTITPRQNGALFLYSPPQDETEEPSRLILIALSGVKNRNSGWDDKGKFHWGRAPAMLKNIDVDIETAQADGLKIYRIDEYGKRGKEVRMDRSGGPVTLSTHGSRTPWFELSYE